MVSAATAGAEMIYFDSFTNTDGASLNGHNPDVPGTSLNWTAAGTGDPRWRISGNQALVTGDPGSDTLNAFLPFVPEDNKIYTLSADVQTMVAGDGAFSLGFTQASNTGASFHAGTRDAGPWFRLRGVGSTADRLRSFRGEKTAGPGTHSDPGDNEVNLKIVLDTTDPVQWTASWFVDGMMVRGPTNLTAGSMEEPMGNGIGIQWVHKREPPLLWRRLCRNHD